MWDKIYKQMTIIKVPKTLANKIRLFFGLKLKTTRELPKPQIKKWSGEIKTGSKTIRIGNII